MKRMTLTIASILPILCFANGFVCPTSIVCNGASADTCTIDGTQFKSAHSMYGYHKGNYRYTATEVSEQFNNKFEITCSYFNQGVEIFVDLNRYVMLNPDDFSNHKLWKIQVNRGGTMDVICYESPQLCRINII